MKRIEWTGLLLSVALIFAGCGKSEPEPEPPPEPKPLAADVPENVDGGKVNKALWNSVTKALTEEPKSDEPDEQ